MGSRQGVCPLIKEGAAGGAMGLPRPTSNMKPPPSLALGQSTARDFLFPLLIVAGGYRTLVCYRTGQ